MLNEDFAGAEQRTGAQQFICNYDIKNVKVSYHINPFFYRSWAVSEMWSSVCPQTMTFSRKPVTVRKKI